MEFSGLISIFLNPSYLVLRDGRISLGLSHLEAAVPGCFSWTWISHLEKLLEYVPAGCDSLQLSVHLRRCTPFHGNIREGGNTSSGSLNCPLPDWTSPDLPSTIECYAESCWCYFHLSHTCLLSFQGWYLSPLRWEGQPWLLAAPS